VPWFQLRAPDNRNAEDIGLELHQQIVYCGAAIDSKGLERRTRVAAHRLQHVGHLERDGFERGARDVSVPGVAAQPINMPAACASQCGAPRPTKAGTNTTPFVSSTLAASAPHHSTWR